MIKFVFRRCSELHHSPFPSTAFGHRLRCRRENIAPAGVPAVISFACTETRAGTEDCRRARRAWCASHWARARASASGEQRRPTHSRGGYPGHLTERNNPHTAARHADAGQLHAFGAPRRSGERAHRAQTRRRPNSPRDSDGTITARVAKRGRLGRKGWRRITHGRGRGWRGQCARTRAKRGEHPEWWRRGHETRDQGKEIGPQLPLAAYFETY